jgi:DNA-binding transcriptional MocR family regulator
MSVPTIRPKQNLNRNLREVPKHLISTTRDKQIPYPDLTYRDIEDNTPQPALPRADALANIRAAMPVVRFLRATADKALVRPKSCGSGFVRLRAAIADHLLLARGLRCDPDQIMLTSGTQHGLRIVLSSILKAKDQIWCEDPGYPAARINLACLWSGAGLWRRPHARPM